MRNKPAPALFLMIACGIWWAAPVSAQVATGTPPFGSFSGGPDIINNANLNVHLTIPVTHKAGRGTNFTYDLTHDSSVWYPVGSSGSQTWAFAGGWGWAAQTQVALGYISYRLISTGVCYVNGRPYHGLITYGDFAYIDSFGTSHAFPGTLKSYLSPCGGGGAMNSTTTDGSGWNLIATATGSSVSGRVIATSGDVIYPPLNAGTGAGTYTDRNGNEISVNGSGGFTDTLGATALTVSGSEPNPVTLAYTAPNGQPAPYTLRYTTYTVQTNFSCPGVGEFGATSESLVSEIDLPDGTKYSFTYEPTYQHAGSVTGRLASVTLPTGGVITYSYGSGGVNGIVCTDGSASTLTRSTPDTGSTYWTYAHSESGTAWTTTITDPQNNQTVLNFQGIYETERQVYSGSATGTPLETLYTCYNGAAPQCNSTAITLPITQRAVTKQWPGGLESQNVSSYNSYGLMTELDQYAYGSPTPGSLVRKTLTSYAALGNGIVDMPASIVVCSAGGTASACNGSGTVVAQTTYSYDQSGSCCQPSGSPQLVAISGSRGNATTVTRWVSSTASSLSKAYSYYDNGNVYQFKDVNGAQYTYGYGGSGGCGSSFVTSITEPVGTLSKSFTWSCIGGVQLTATDENGQTATTNYTNADFWRPDSVEDQMSPPNTTSLTYNGQTSVESTLNFGNSTTDALATLDSMGRLFISQRKQSPSSGTYDSVETAYDPLGRPNSVTLPYSGGNGGTCSGSCPGTETTYDALGRPLTVTDSGGLNTTYQYNANDVLETVGPAPSGENTKRKQYEYDALGRLTSVCEITNASGSGPCPQTHSGETGYFTQYTYDALGDLATVTQGGGTQTRHYNYDGLRRMTSETNPESGTTTYYYDVIPAGCYAAGNASAGDLTGIKDAAGSIVCPEYDALHRTIAVGSNSGCRRFSYDNSQGVTGSRPSGVTVNYGMGRMIEAETDNCSAWPPTPITDEWFSYDARGEATDLWESTPNSSGYYHLSESYWANGTPSGITVPGTPTITYGVDGEGRWNSASASFGQNPLANATYNSGSGTLATLNYGSTDTDTFGYDAMNRMNKYTFTVNGQPVVGSPTWNPNGSLGTLSITDPFKKLSLV